MVSERDALKTVLLTELTSQDDRSELKEEAPLNTAQEEMGESEENLGELGKAKAKGPLGSTGPESVAGAKRWEGLTAFHAGDGAHIPRRQIRAEGRGFLEHCSRGDV